MEKQMNETLWGYKQVAEFLNVKLSTVYAKVCRKEIPHRRLSGRLVRFVPSEIAAWVEAGRVEAMPSEGGAAQ